jgi:hypothetical protein
MDIMIREGEFVNLPMLLPLRADQVQQPDARPTTFWTLGTVKPRVLAVFMVMTRSILTMLDRTRPV